jgi:hypothetical protein
MIAYGSVGCYFPGRPVRSLRSTTPHSCRFSDPAGYNSQTARIPRNAANAFHAFWSQWLVPLAITVLSLLTIGLRAQQVQGAQAIGQSAAQQKLSEANLAITSTVRLGVSSGSRLRSAITTRADLLRATMRTEPSSVRSYALDQSVRSAILSSDPTLAPLMEHDTTLTAELSATVEDDFPHGSAKTRYILHTCDADYELSFAKPIAGLERMLSKEVTVRGIALPGIIAVDSLTRAERREQCELPTSHAALSSQAGSVPAQCSATGVQRFAVLIVHFPNETPAYPNGMDDPAYWQAVFFGNDPSLAGYLSEVSYGLTTAQGDVFAPISISESFDCSSQEGGGTDKLEAAVIATAAKSIDFSQYNRIVIVFPTGTSVCGYGAAGSEGCRGATASIGHEYSVIFLPVGSANKPDFQTPSWGAGAAHELGHNLKLQHAGTLDFGPVALGPLDFDITLEQTGGLPTSPNPLYYDYGDPFSAMGGSWTMAPYSVEHRARLLGWIPKSDEIDVTAAGRYTITPAENASGLRVMRILRDAVSGSWLWVEFHQPIGYYTTDNIAKIQSSTLSDGVLIHYDSLLNSMWNLESYLMDMNPVAIRNNFADATLGPGKSWSDPYTPLTISVSNQTSSSIDVTVSYDQQCATASLSTSELAVGGGIANLSISAPSGCSWVVSSNTSWIQLSGATSGSGNATVPFTYAANTGDSQRTGYISVGRQSVVALQDGPGITAAAITPSQGSGSSQTFVLTMQDSAGANDFAGRILWFAIGEPGTLNGGFTGESPCEVAVGFSPGTPQQYTEIDLFATTQSGVTAGTVFAGKGGAASNNSCTVYGNGSSAQFNGNELELTLNFSFSSAFNGAQNLVEIIPTSSGEAWIPLGVFTVNVPTRITPPITVSLSSVTIAASDPLRVVVTVSGTPTPTGSVTLESPGYLPTAVGLNNGTATFNVPAGTLPVGSDTLNISYTPDNSSTSIYNSAFGTAAVVVTAPGKTTPTVTVTPSSSSITTAQALSVTVTVSGGGSNPTPTGTVTLTSGNYTSSAATLTGGSATISVPAGSLTTGTDTLAAAYSGDGNYVAATGTASISVNPAPSFTLSASPTNVSIAQGGSGTSTITVNAIGGFSGEISFSADSLPNGVTASFAAGSVAETQVLTLGASNSAAVTSTPVTVMVTGTSGSLSASTSIALTITAQPSFTAGSGETTSITIGRGATTGNTGTISVVGTNGFSGTVSLSCKVSTAMTNVNDMPSCTLNPASVTISGTGAQTSTLTISTTAATSSENQLKKGLWPSAGGAALALLVFFAVPKRRNWLGMMCILALLVFVGILGCGGGGGSQGGGGGGGGGNSGTTVGNYTITVTGTSGTISATVGTITLTVQ